MAKRIDEFRAQNRMLQRDKEQLEQRLVQERQELEAKHEQLRLVHETCDIHVTLI